MSSIKKMKRRNNLWGPLGQSVIKATVFNGGCLLWFYCYINRNIVVKDGKPKSGVARLQVEAGKK